MVLDSGRPTIHRNLRNVEAREGDEIKLELFVVGEPQPDIRWYQNDIPITPNENRVFLRNDDKYSLVIDSCSISNSGEYKAVLSNVHGEVQTKCRLNVFAKPVPAKSNVEPDEPVLPYFKMVPPYFLELLKDIKINVGQDVCFKCKIVGEPEPQVKWYKDGDLLEETNHVKVNFFAVLVSECFRH